MFIHTSTRDVMETVVMKNSPAQTLAWDVALYTEAILEKNLLRIKTNSFRGKDAVILNNVANW